LHRPIIASNDHRIDRSSHRAITASTDHDIDRSSHRAITASSDFAASTAERIDAIDASMR
jgi:hypothetical protein